MTLSLGTPENDLKPFVGAPIDKSGTTTKILLCHYKQEYATSSVNKPQLHQPPSAVL